MLLMTYVVTQSNKLAKVQIPPVPLVLPRVVHFLMLPFLYNLNAIIYHVQASMHPVMTSGLDALHRYV